MLEIDLHPLLNYGGISTSSVRNDEALERLLDDYERQQFGDEQP